MKIIYLVEEITIIFFQFCPDGGFVISGDCSEAMLCYTYLFPLPGRTLKCDPGYKVAVDFYSLE